VAGLAACGWAVTVIARYRADRRPAGAGSSRRSASSAPI